MRFVHMWWFRTRCEHVDTGDQAEPVHRQPEPSRRTRLTGQLDQPAVAQHPQRRRCRGRIQTEVRGDGTRRSRRHRDAVDRDRGEGELFEHHPHDRPHRPAQHPRRVAHDHRPIRRQLGRVGRPSRRVATPHRRCPGAARAPGGRQAETPSAYPEEPQQVVAWHSQLVTDPPARHPRRSVRGEVPGGQLVRRRAADPRHVGGLRYRQHQRQRVDIDDRGDVPAHASRRYIDVIRPSTGAKSEAGHSRVLRDTHRYETVRTGTSCHRKRHRTVTRLRHVS